ncbi:MAG: energy-coupling factor transporter transmembrane protein EcfT [Ruminococcaceae bacterium]|nr:energy-coupling factor transporter transmembrane protein EcfT [Oscillospiraceae bacterium]
MCSMEASFGVYYEKDSLIHRLDPRTKLLFMIVFLVSIFVAKDIFSYLLLILITVASIIISKVPFMMVLKGLKPIFVIVIFTTILNLFWTQGETELVNWQVIPNHWTIVIYKESLIKAGVLALRIIVLMACTSLYFSYTTTPIELTDGIETGLAPLKKIKVPVHEFAMMMTIALRFIPTLVDETAKIMNAQKARGADFSRGGLIKRAKALIPIIIPLFVSAFRRADELATAMECRCYRGGTGRTRMKVLKMKARDYVFLLLTVLMIAGVIILNIYAKGYKV